MKGMLVRATAVLLLSLTVGYMLEWGKLHVRHIRNSRRRTRLVVRHGGRSMHR